jgi:hypothetical protein
MTTAFAKRSGLARAAAMVAALLLSAGEVRAAGGDRPGSWTEVARMNVGRSAHTLVVLDDGRVLAVGGSSADNWAYASEVFDAHGGSGGMGAWTLTPQIGGDATPWGSNVPLAAKLDDGRVLVTGGIAAVLDFPFFGGGTPDLRAFLYDPRTNTWSQTDSLPVGVGSGVGGNAVVLHGGDVLVAGGYATDADHNLIASDVGLIYRVHSGTWDYTRDLTAPGNPQTRMPRGMTHNRLALMTDGRVLCIGGGHGVFDNFSDGDPINAVIFDPATGRWSAAGNQMPEIAGEEVNPPGLGGGRQWPVVVALGGDQVLVAGGSTLNGGEIDGDPSPSFTPRTSALVFDGRSETWTQVGSLAVSHAFSDTFYAVDAESAVLLPAAGDWQYPCGVGSVDVEQFSLRTSSFRPLAPFPTAGFPQFCDFSQPMPAVSPGYGTARLMNDRRGIFAGGAVDFSDPNWGPSARTFLFTPNDD